MAAAVPCEYRGEYLGMRKVKCCRGRPDLNLKVFDCTLGNTGHQGMQGVTWRDCNRTYHRLDMCTPGTCLKARTAAKANG